MIARNDDYFSTFLRNVYFRIRLPSDGTREDYESIARAFGGWHQSQPDFAPWGISPELIGGYMEWQMSANGLSGSTVNKHRRTLRAIIRVAMRRKLLSIDLDEIPLAKQLKKHPNAWWQAELEEMLAVARELPGRVGPWPMKNWLPALMLTCLSTDWRISAVMQLKTARTSIKSRYAISTESKQHKERAAKLTEQCAEALSLIWDDSRDEVFGDWPYDRSGRQWKALNNLLGRVIESAGVPDIGRWHAFRKTATTMIADRLGRSEAARFAGHSRQQVTDEYYVDDTKLTGPSASDALPRLRDVRKQQDEPANGSA